MISIHIVIPLQKKNQSPCQETGSVVKPEVMVPEMEVSPMPSVLSLCIITALYSPLSVRACVCAWIRSYPVNSRPGDVSWKRNMQMLMRFPVGGFTDGSTFTKNTIEWS